MAQASQVGGWSKDTTWHPGSGAAGTASSPRYPLAVELAVALEQTKQLMDEYRKTDELADQLIEEATETNRELVLQSQLQRHSGLVQDMEVEYSEDYMYIQLEALRAEFDEVEASPPGDASAEEEMLVNP